MCQKSACCNSNNSNILDAANVDAAANAAIKTSPTLTTFPTKNTTTAGSPVDESEESEEFAKILS
jgi:hypothetical protein